jgi:hypothetical protein
VPEALEGTIFPFPWFFQAKVDFFSTIRSWVTQAKMRRLVLNTASRETVILRVVEAEDI